MNHFIAVTNIALESIDKIFRSGLRGTHLLFTNRMIREAFSREEPLENLLSHEVATRLQDVVVELLEKQDLLEQREDFRWPLLMEREQFIESLDPTIRAVLVHLYFGFLDRYLNGQTTPEVLH